MLIRNISYLCLLLGSALAAGEHPAVPEGAPRGAVQVTIDGKALGVYARHSISYAAFPVSGRHRVVVTADTDITGATVRPLARKLAAAIDGRSASLEISAPGQYCLELDGGPTVMLFADPPELYRAPAAGKDTIVFGPGLHPAKDEKEDLELQSGQTLYVAAGAYVQRRYLRVRGAQGVRVRGPGVLAMGVRIENSSDVLVDGPVFDIGRKDWMNRIDVSEDVSFRWTKSLCLDTGVNNDGFDIMSGCRRIRIEDSFIRSNDDVVVLKHHPHSAGYWGSKTPTTDVLVSRCVLWNLNGGNVFEFGVETIGSSLGRFRAEDCDVIRADSKTGGVFDIAAPDHARIHDLEFERIRVERFAGKLIEMVQDHGRYRTGEARGRIEGVYFRDIEVLQAGSGQLTGVSGGGSFDGVHFHDVRIQGKRADSLADLGLKAKAVTGITFNEDRRPPRDMQPPRIVAALGFALHADAPGLIQIACDEQLDPVSARRPETWRLTPPLAIAEVRLDPGLFHATLVTAPLRQRPTLRIQGLADLTGNRLDAAPAIAWHEACDLALDLPPRQGLAGFWFEQWNPEPVMTWSGRPDLMQAPTHWLISWLPAKDGEAWTGHDNALRIRGARMQISARFQPVRTWRAPFAGTVRIGGAVAAGPAAVTARIARTASARQREDGDVLWEGAVAAGGTAVHTVEVAVAQDDILRCRLVGPAGAAADWAPMIRYLHVMHVAR